MIHTAIFKCHEIEIDTSLQERLQRFFKDLNPDVNILSVTQSQSDLYIVITIIYK